ncbi:pyridoxamine 5'-phosphate oxidase family protein [Candidatus Parcubacteria bacterium]|nr:pyridoxamine 5'-phosphate oxidase family protein [Candidatus Parcubacteria bacterium]
MDVKAKILEVLSKGHLMSLATQDEGGLWVSDVIYIFDEDLNIYWMSDPDVRHSKSVLKNGQAAGSITITNNGEKPELGIQFSGIAEKIDGPRFDLAKKHFTKRGKPVPEESEDILEGDSWYVLHPKKIDLIDAEHYGWKKVSLDL